MKLKQTKKDYFKDEPGALDLYSFWISGFFIIWVLFGSFLPSWMNPFITIYIGTIVQLIIFYFGKRFVPKWLFMEIAIWKWSMFALTMLLFDRNYDLKTINFNLFLFSFYLLIIHLRGYHVFGVYLDYVLNKKRYFQYETPYQFHKDRLKTII